MDDKVKKAIYSAVEKEPFAKALKMKLIDINDGYSLVEMKYEAELMNNIYDRAHGGAIFALIDEAFETASQTDGTIAVALNINVTYAASPENGAILKAEAKEIKRTKKTAIFEIKVFSQDKDLIATCQAVAYRTGKPIPFI
ncbi:MAG: PaaI family thioesterase [Desulfobacterales bacterium]|nr:PaaI family thioesterase [Desulfobacterales bacterium]